MTPIGSLALELWSLVDGIVFDNFLLTSDQSIAKQYADQLWDPKSILEGRPVSPSTSSSSKTVLDTIIDATKRRPWLLAVYVSGILLPILLIIILLAYCLLRKSKTKKTSKRTNKKNDDYEEEIENDQHKIQSKISKKDASKKASIGHRSRRRTRKE